MSEKEAAELPDLPVKSVEDQINQTAEDAVNWEKNMEITRKSMMSGVTRTRDLPITAAQLEAWRNGALVQNAFPNLSPSDREFLMTGMTDEEWDKAFAEVEEPE